MSTKLDSQDRRQLAKAGIESQEVERQVEILRRPPAPARLRRPCTRGDGIVTLEPAADDEYLDAWRNAADHGRLSKFVPASGAASRMFDAAQTVSKAGDLSRRQLRQRREHGDRAAADVLELLDHSSELPFARALATSRLLRDTKLSEVENAEEVSRFLAALLSRQGLGYATLAKGLIPFHRYGDEMRTAFAEHLVEGSRYVTDRNGMARFHLTIAKAHRAAFEAAAEAFDASPAEVTFSTQDHSTDTVALGSGDRLARDLEGQLVLRPGGHGSLLSNLERIEGDIVFVKNIDNVTVEHLHPEISLWQKRLAGLLLGIEAQSHRLQSALAGSTWADSLEAAEAFCRRCFSWAPHAGAPQERRAEVLGRLDRPLRVCGMVRNEGEPGGGPFWVADAAGDESPQIVESAQVDLTDPSQAAIWNAATHFNPVLLVLSLRDRDAKPYALRSFVDPDAVFVTEKSVGGERCRVLEHPGLWNGSMAHWNTVFAEVPSLTFSPVKTVLDLLRPAHRTLDD